MNCPAAEAGWLVKKDKSEACISRIVRFLTPMEGTRLFNMAVSEGVGESVTPQKAGKGGKDPSDADPEAVAGGKAQATAASPKPKALSKRPKAAPAKATKVAAKAPRRRGSPTPSFLRAYFTRGGL